MFNVRHTVLSIINDCLQSYTVIIGNTHNDHKVVIINKFNQSIDDCESLNTDNTTYTVYILT